MQGRLNACIVEKATDNRPMNLPAIQVSRSVVVVACPYNECHTWLDGLLPDVLGGEEEPGKPDIASTIRGASFGRKCPLWVVEDRLRGSSCHSIAQRPEERLRQPWGRGDF
jgi:hypothetical protein